MGKRGATLGMYRNWGFEDFYDLPIRKKPKGQPLKKFQASLLGLSASIGNSTVSTINQAFEVKQELTPPINTPRLGVLNSLRSGKSARQNASF